MRRLDAKYEQMIALSYLRRRLVERREMWQHRYDTAHRSSALWATRLQALGAREALREAVLACDEAIDLLDNPQEVTKLNGS